MGLQFYPKSHRYKLDGRWVAGVTTIIGVLDKPAIPKGAARSVAEYVSENLHQVNEIAENSGSNALVAMLKEVPWDRRDKAAGRGTTLHDIAEQLLTAPDGVELDADDPLLPVAENALAFVEEWQIEPLAVERPCASRTHQYAGTFDLVARYTAPNGQSGIGIFDWKSGKAIYPGAVWQMNAYGHSEFYNDEDGAEVPTADLGIDSAFGVHLRDDDYDVHPLKYGPDVFEDFTKIRQVFAANKAANGNYREPGTGYVGLPIRREL